MRAYILRRLLISIPLVFLMTFLVFAVINLNPEASIQRYIMQPNVSFQFIEQEKERLGLYDPLPVRYLRWLGGVLGDIRFGRETRSLVSFADAGVLRATFGLRSSLTLETPALVLDGESPRVDLASRIDGHTSDFPSARHLAALSIDIINPGSRPSTLTLSAVGKPDPDAEPRHWEKTATIDPDSAITLTLRAAELSQAGLPIATLTHLTLSHDDGDAVEIRQIFLTTNADVIRPARGRPYVALPLLAPGHVHSFTRLGSPYTRQLLPRSDWAPVGKVIAVEDTGGQPVDVVERRGFRALQLEVGNPLATRQSAVLQVTSGSPDDTTVTRVPFSIAPERRETVEFRLPDLIAHGVDPENVLHLGIEATAAGMLFLSRTHLVFDERPFHIGWTPNFGTSYENNLPVLRRLGGRVRNTILLVISAMLLTWMVALPFGVIAAVRQYSPTDRILSFVSFIGMALPGFFLAILVRYVASLADDPNSMLSFLPALPTSGRISADHDQLDRLGRMLDILRHAILPVLVLGMGGMAGMQRVMRGTMLETLRQPFITTARAKGLSERVVVYKHALRNAITPFVAGFGSILPALIGGSALIEIVFNYPGVGQLMLPAVLNRDINLVMGNTLIAALLLVLGNLIADILLAWVDPRVSYD